MYYKVNKNSITGRKIQELDLKRHNCLKMVNEFILKVGASEACINRFAAFGGCEVLIFDNDPDSKEFRRIREIKNGYLPKLSCNRGKELDREMRSLPIVTISELNMCLGIYNIFTPIEYWSLSKDFYGIIVPFQFKYQLPADCTQINQQAFINKAI